MEVQDVDLTTDPMLIKVYASKTARATGNPSRVVPVLFPILCNLLVEAIESAGRFVVDEQVPRQKGSDHKTLTRILKRAGLERWRPGFQILRACCERDFLDFGLSEYRYTRAIGHSPEVSRRDYLARFEGAVLDDNANTEFKRADERARALIEGQKESKSESIAATPGDTSGIHERCDCRKLRVSEGIRTPDPLDHNQVL